MTSQDTICAISTAPGTGGIAVARVSGPQALDITSRIWKGRQLSTLTPRSAHLGPITDSQGQLLDNALVTLFRAPASYTGEDCVEISVHGSRWIQQELIASLCKAGARLARPGEFTRRAVMSGKIDLSEAEGVADMIASRSRASHRLAIKQMRGDLSRRLGELRDKLVELASLLELELDFSEEDVEFASRDKLKALATETLAEATRLERSFESGSALRDGIPVAIVGATNAGKSSLLNVLTEDDRAIVSEIHGTTRDVVEDTISLGDYTFRIHDTAGLRETADPIETLGIERTKRAAADAQIILLVLDSTVDEINWDIVRMAQTPLSKDDDSQLIIAVNKTDLSPAPRFEDSLKEIISTSVKMGYKKNPLRVDISAKTATGIEQLRTTLMAIASKFEDGNDVVITNERHRNALWQASGALAGVLNGLNQGHSADFIAQDLRTALNHLGEITGTITTDEILASIFSRFCIGK